MLARQIAIGFGIAIVFPLLVYYGVAASIRRLSYRPTLPQPMLLSIRRPKSVNIIWNNGKLSNKSKTGDTRHMKPRPRISRAI